MKRPSLRQVNNVLSLAVIALCLYLLSAPFWPRVSERFRDPPPLVQAEQPPGTSVPPPAENTLVIPRINLQETIHEGNKWTLSKGIWHVPDTGSPAQGGNMVLSGHRFTYGGPAVLYHLDQVKVGDSIVVYWQQRKYYYDVKEVREVPPTENSILANTTEQQLTIYTCTPLITAKNRLVIIARFPELQSTELLP